MSMGWLIWFVAIKIELGKTQFSKQLALINIYNAALNPMALELSGKASRR